MTFDTFAKIVHSQRPELEVHPHGSARGNYSGARGGKCGNAPRVAVIYPNGKLYQYSGSYGEVLGKLGIKTVDRSDVMTLEANLRSARERHGKPNIFSAGKPLDLSGEISRLEASLAKCYSSEYIRVWEFA